MPKRYKGKRYTRRRRGTSARFIRKVVSNMSEHKHRYDGFDQALPTSTLCTLSIPRCACGTDRDARIGAKVFLKGIKVRLWVTAGNASDLVRMMIVRAKDASTSSTDLPYGNGSITDAIDTDKFEVIRDKCFSVGTAAGADFAIRPGVFRKFYIPLNRTIKYHNTGATDYIAGSEHIIALGIVNQSAGATGYVKGNVIQYFRDI